MKKKKFGDVQHPTVLVARIGNSFAGTIENKS